MRRVRRTLRRIESYSYPPQRRVITIPIWVWLPGLTALLYFAVR